jgi:hypothetical protein
MNRQAAVYSRCPARYFGIYPNTGIYNQNAIADDSECILLKLIKQVTDHKTGEFCYEMYWNYRSNER